MPTEKSKNFRTSVKRLSGLLRPQRWLLAIVVVLAVCGSLANVLGPRVNPARRRAHGLGADRRDHRAGARPLIGTDAFQEADITGITMPVTKHNMPGDRRRGYPARDRRGVPPGVARADPARCWWTSPRTCCRRRRRSAGRPSCDLPGYRPTTAAARQADPRGRRAHHRRRSARCSTSAAACSRRGPRGAPGARRADRHPGRHHADGPGRVPRQPPAAPRDARHARLGPRGRRPAEVRPADRPRRALRRPGHRASSPPSRPDAKIVHVDIDPAEIGKNRRADVPIVGDCQGVLDRADRPPSRPSASTAPRTCPRGGRSSTTWRHATRWATTGPTTAAVPAVRDPADRQIAGPGRDLRGGRRPAPDVGRAVHPATRSRAPGSTPAASARWATRCPPRWAPRSRCPDTVVWAIDGDGCFQMTNQELATCAIEGIPIKVAVINNGNLGMVRQWQTLFYGERYSQTDLGTHKHRIPDFLLLAEAHGLRRPAGGVARRGRQDHPRRDGDQRPPGVIDFVVGRGRQVGRWWPPAPATTSSWPRAASGRSSTATSWSPTSTRAASPRRQRATRRRSR